MDEAAFVATIGANCGECRMAAKLIGIDPGLAATGIGVVSGSRGKPHAYAYGVVKTSRHESTANRLETIYSRLRCLFDDERPQLVVIEDVFSLEKYPQSGITLGKVCGVVALAAQHAHVDVIEVPVREAKQILTGNGNASKEQLEAAVRNAVGAPERIRPYHASDALGLALIGLFRYGDQVKRVQ